MMMDAEEELLQMSVLEKNNPIIYKLLLENLLVNHYAVFKSFLIRELKKKPSIIDVNYVYPDPVKKTLLDIACSQGKTDFVRLLVDNGAETNKINEFHGRAPIHFASEYGYHDVIGILLDDSRTNPNLEVNRETALHFAVQKNYIMCVKVLLDNNSSPNIPNSKGVTPLHAAVTLGYRDIVDTIMNYSRLKPDIDSYRDFRKKTTRVLLINKYPDIILPPEEIQKIDFNVLRFYLDANDEDHFLENLNKIEEKQIDHIDRLIVMCAEKNFCKGIVGLLEKTKAENGDGLPYEALDAAVKRGNYQILQQFLKSGSKVDGDLVLTAARELGVPCCSGVEQGSRLKCLKIILNQPGVNVRCEDDKGNTPLHYAARAEDTEAIQLLLKLGSYIGHKNVLGVPPLANISPSLLSDYFDSCLHSSNDRTDEYEIEFDYKCLMPHSVTFGTEDSAVDDFLTSNYQMNDPCTMEMEPLRYISQQPALKHLLKHPILSSFLSIKWHRIRQILYANFVFYVIFYTLMNCYILFMAYNDGTTTNGTSKLENLETKNSDIIFLTSWNQPSMLLTLTAALLFLLASREFIQLISSPRHYVQSIENWLEVTLIILGIAVLCGAGSQVGSIVILLSAWELVVLIGQHPRMSTSIQMFKTVSINFMKFLFLYAFLIFSFALAFFTLFKNGDDGKFFNPVQSLFKTIVMLTGEFDASDIPFDLHPTLGRFIFVLFVFLIAIVLFNLLNGLAVSDTADILGKAELVGLVSRTELISYVERISIGENANSRGKCCIQLMSNRFKLLGFMTKRILMFPNYLPLGKISVKPYKSNVIRISGKNHQNKGCRNFSMDDKIVDSARAILSENNRVSEGEKIMIELMNINQRINRFEETLESIERSLKNNSLKPTDSIE